MYSIKFYFLCLILALVESTVNHFQQGDFKGIASVTPNWFKYLYPSQFTLAWYNLDDLDEAIELQYNWKGNWTTVLQIYSDRSHTVCQNFATLSPGATYELSFDYVNAFVDSCRYLAYFNG